MTEGLIKWLLVCLLLTHQIHAQTTYGNEWINPTQPYLRLAVSQTGWYRLNANDIQKQGIDLSTIQPQSLQLFRRGQEVSILVEGENDGRLDTTDFVGFYGQRNDGQTDTSLYESPRLMPHPHYSLYSDTAAYFLTWASRESGVSMTGKRIPQLTSTPLPATADYHYEQHLQLFTNEYPAGAIYPAGAWYDTGYIMTPYDEGEGWTGSMLSLNQWGSAGVQATTPIRSRMAEASVEILFVGRYSGPHHVEVWVGTTTQQTRKLGELRWNDYSTALFKASLLPEDLDGSSGITISFQNRTPASVSASYARWVYPQELRLSELTTQKALYPAGDVNLLVPSEPAMLWLDVADPYHPTQLTPEIAEGTTVLSAGSNHPLLAVKTPLSVGSLRPVRFKTIDPQATNYLIISHPLVRKPVEVSPDPVAEYAAYRASEQGGGYLPLVLNMDEVADQFNYGEPGPNGIRKLIKWLHDRGRLRYTFLIGRSVSPQIVRSRSTARSEDMIPSAGWPDSDIALAMGLDSLSSSVPIVPVGRLNAYNSRNVWDYLQKVKQHEIIPSAAPWRKNVLHLSGGRTGQELVTYRNFVDQYATTINPSFLAPTIGTISKQTDEPVERFPIAPIINEGVALMTLFGHSSLSISDIDIGFATNTALGYRNQGRYPAVVVNGCAIGNFYFGPTPISTDWVLAPNRGAILFLAHTHNGLEAGMYRYTSSLYEVLAEPDFASRPFGDIMREAIRRNVGINQGLSDRVTVQQMNLQGDPAVVIFPATKPDYTWNTAGIRITNLSGGAITTWNDSLRIKAEILNYGRLKGDTYTIIILRKRGTELLARYTFTRKAVPFRDSLNITLTNESRLAGEESWEFVIDPTDEIAEEDETNNGVVKMLTISEGGVIPLFPADLATLNNPSVELIAQIPTGRVGQLVVFERSTNQDFTGNIQQDTVTTTGILVRKQVQVIGSSPQIIYWRVYVPGDSTANFRQIWYDEAATAPSASLPEGVASLPTTFTTQLEEGAVFKTTVTFENIAPVAFGDSVEVLVRETGEQHTSTSRFKIPPLKAQSIYTFAYSTTTSGKVGQNRVLIYFNSNQLPEQLLANNWVDMTYAVRADQTPPVLDVTLDNRRLRDMDVVSPKAGIQIRLRDSNPYLLRSDTTDLRVRLQPECGNCAEIAVGLEAAQWSRTPTTDFQLELSLPTLLPGIYLLGVEGKDLSGNAAAPYQIRFRVTDITRINAIKVSPNPAQYWVKFELELEGKAPPKNWTIQLFEPNGKLIRTLQKTPNLGTNEIYWFPIGVASGLYLYEMLLDGEEWKDMAAGNGRILLSH